MQKKNEAERKFKNCANVDHEQVMEECKLRQTTNIITNFISKALTICHGPMNKKLVMAKAISHVQVCDDLPTYILPAKATICSTRHVCMCHEGLR
jgi:hypothetical protein